MEDVPAGVPVEPHDDLRGLTWRQVDGVIPARVVGSWCTPAAARHLERRLVDAHRVMQIRHQSPDLHVTQPRLAHALLDQLAHREREVLTEVGGGLSDDEIALRLQMSPATARTHVSRIMTKMGVRDRAQLVVLAYRSGLPVPGSG